jgi:hypothetical protein
MIDTPWALLREDTDEVKRLKRERDEALALAEERKTYWDSEYRAYEDMRSLWHAALRERDEWRECAERLADAFRGVPYDPYTVGGFNAQKCKEALAEYRRLKEASK